jgi:mono/diheme cytochrome c family protein
MFPLRRPAACCLVAGLVFCTNALFAADAPETAVSFNRDIRSILSNNCFICHGPDDAERQGDLRLDSRAGALAEHDGHAAVVPGHPESSELIARITSSDPDVVMPPPETGRKLTAKEVDLLTRWIKQGAEFSGHWAYQQPVRTEFPTLKDDSRIRNGIDRFIQARLQQEGLSPSEDADRYSLIRRVSLDLTGLPPTLEEVEQFINDKSADAYEKLVDRLLEKDAYGEHWARMWLDLARYADSAGYADDPARTIWAFRDYVIRSLNSNKPFDQFTIEQIAGDLLPEPTEDQLIATAFHRNTLTNNEGGTNDEEFRNVAIVDRVNTTMAVWMGTTIACAQCHNHKYDPISQEEYFRFFAFFNSSQDADRRDESPIIQIYSDEQKQNKRDWQLEVEQLQKTLSTPTPELLASLAVWEKSFQVEPAWTTLTASDLKTESNTALTINDSQIITAEKQSKTDVFTVEFPLEKASKMTALQIETLPGPNFVVSRVLASIIPPEGTRLAGRYVRVEMPGTQKMLSLAEVQVFSGADNVAVRGVATQSSTDFGGPANLAIDGNTDGDYQKAKSTTHTAVSDNPWWEVDLQSTQPIDRLALWNRTDGNLHTRLSNFSIRVLDEKREPVWEQKIAESPNPSIEQSLSTARGIPFVASFADYTQKEFDPTHVINNSDPKTKGWAVGGQADKSHQLTLIPKQAVEVEAGSRLSVRIEQVSQHENHTLSQFKVAVTSEPQIAQFAQTPAEQLNILRTASGERSAEQSQKLTTYYLASVAPALNQERTRLAQLEKQLASMKPATSVPVMRDLDPAQRRVTKIQIRGNFEQTGDEVREGIPAVFHSLPDDVSPNRLALARWLIDDKNPLTARVIANRYWESIFGVGIVSTSEEFGSQGDQPVHPELLDWLAIELVDGKWDIKRLLKLLVTSTAYRQSSRVTPELVQRDPDNRLLARGPRFRLSAEMIRDQALAVSGLLSHKMFGAPVRPLQPSMGLSAAFGSSTDWQTSTGDDRFRRGLYTTWRRSNPYPSMAAFDAPNREVCTVRRDRTNTPLQALVTLNDPVYVEAAQALARRIAAFDGDTDSRVDFGFRLCATRPPQDHERERLTQLFGIVREKFAESPDAAMQMATDPLGPVPEGMNAVDLAAWTVVGNVLLNLDEMLMKR